jgi:hypothetical protein
VGGHVRLVLRGFNQRQVVEHVPTGEEEYYMCLSHLRVIGLGLPEYALPSQKKEGEFCRQTGQNSIIFTGDLVVDVVAEDENNVCIHCGVMSEFVQTHTNNNSNGEKDSNTSSNSSK